MHGVESAPSPWLILPFVLLLAAIAAMPLIAGAWWEKRYKVVAAGLGVLTGAYYVGWMREGEKVLHALVEYASFVALVGSLFVIAGNIHVTIKGRATPAGNVAMLAIGAILANILGTTGASMLLLRPYLGINKYRVSAFHVVFFIFLVSNVGGGLTPIGDPPLFLGYIRGIPFFWITGHAFLPWLTAVILLLGGFYLIDRRSFNRMSDQMRTRVAADEDRTRLLGARNLLFLAIVLGAVFIERPMFLREMVMIGAAAASYRTTNREIRARNRFTFHPIEEVAWIFLGIFLTMIPALDWLAANASMLGIESPTGLYWGTGLLSSFLDNAPTYLNFLAAAMAGAGRDVGVAADVRGFLESGALRVVAISVGAVFFGAMSYIGNAPNFMVKSIAEQTGVRMPGFFGYIVRFSVPLLLPVLIIVWLLFFL